MPIISAFPTCEETPIRPITQAEYEALEDSEKNADVIYVITDADGSVRSIVFSPSVSADGTLSWENNGGLKNPDPINIKGSDGKSAYQYAVAGGYNGTEAEFGSLIGSGPWIKGKGSLASTEDSELSLTIDPQKGAIEKGSFEWSSSAMPTAADWGSVVFGDGKFVAVASVAYESLEVVDGPEMSVGSTEEATVVYSTDGTNWTPANLPYFHTWDRVVYGGGKFVSIASDSIKTIYSEDGITWSASELPSVNSWNCLSYGVGKFVAIACGSDIAAYSTDGIAWVESTLPLSGNWRALAYGNGKFVALSDSTKALYSENGIAWTAIELPINSLWNSLIYGDRKFVAVSGNSKDVIYSEDGLNWFTTTMPSGTNYYSIAYGDGRFVATTGQETGEAGDTDEGATEDSGAEEEVGGFEYTDTAVEEGEENSVVMGAEGTSEAESIEATDEEVHTGEVYDGSGVENGEVEGVEVDSVPIDNGTENIGSEYEGAVETEADFVYSDDGINWIESTSQANLCGAIAYGGGKFVVVPSCCSDISACGKLVKANHLWLNLNGKLIGGDVTTDDLKAAMEDVANKQYVDDAVSMAITGAMEASY